MYIPILSQKFSIRRLLKGMTKVRVEIICKCDAKGDPTRGPRSCKKYFIIYSHRISFFKLAYCLIFEQSDDQEQT